MDELIGEQKIRFKDLSAPLKMSVILAWIFTFFCLCALGLILLVVLTL